MTKQYHKKYLGSYLFKKRKLMSSPPQPDLL